MPFITADRRVAQALAREAEKFARRVRQIPVDKDAGPHPEVKEMLAAFQRINKLMAKQRGIVTLSQKLIASPPVDLWPNVVRRFSVPADVEKTLVSHLERDQ